jgi:hypothetical protein
MQNSNNSRAVAAPLGDNPSRRRFLAAGSAASAFGVLSAAAAREAGRELTEEEQHQLLDVYDEWLWYERKLLHIERFGMEAARDSIDYIPRGPAGNFHFPSDRNWDEAPQPSTRAELVLKAIGCPWRRPA